MLRFGLNVGTVLLGTTLVVQKLSLSYKESNLLGLLHYHDLLSGDHEAVLNWEQSCFSLFGCFFVLHEEMSVLFESLTVGLAMF